MPNWGIYISIDQLGYPAASVGDVVRVAATINRDAGLRLLGTYNLALSLGALRADMHGGRADRLAAQQALLRNTISEARLRELKHKLGNADLVKRPLFHRAQLLAMIKLVARYGHPSAGNRLDTRDDFDVVAELALLVNSLMGAASSVGDPGDAVAPLLAPSIELENPSSVAESMVRSSRMLGPHLATIGRHNRFAKQVERAFVFQTGLNFTELIDFIFALWSFYSTLSVDDLVASQRRGHFNPLLPTHVVSATNMQRLLNLVSVPFGELPGIACDADDRGLLIDFTGFRQHPVWQLAPDNYLCVEPSLLQEKLSSGVYWTIMNALDEEHAEHFSRVWGRAFELRMFEVLESFCHQGTVYRSPRFSDTQDEAFDAVVDAGDRLVVIQAKGSFVRAAAKYSGLPDPFFLGVDERFGTGPGRALGQMKTNLLECFGLGTGRLVEQFRGRRFREILPMIVYQEPVLNFGPVTRHYARLLDEQLRGTLFQLDMMVRPVVFMHIDDFHLIAQHVRNGSVSFIDVLHRKLEDDPGHVLSFGAFWVETLRPKLGLQAAADPLLSAQFKEIGDESLQRFGRGDYL